MARINNAITFGSGFNISALGPIDSRMRVEYESDLIDASTWPASSAPVYDGMSVVVMETGDIWVLKNKANYQDTSTGDGWVKIGSNGGGTADLFQEVTYAELKALRDNKQLVPGQQYRITDYVTTTAQANTQSAGHQFDIIVTADDVDKLNENARAIQHTDGATYYSWVTHDVALDIQFRILVEERTYTNSSNGVCDIPGEWEGLAYYLTAYPIAGVIYVDGSEGGYLNDEKIIISVDNDTITFGDSPYNYLMERYDEETAEGLEHEYTLEQIEWFNGKYFIDVSDTEQLDATYDGTYVDVDTYFANSKLESWELKYCLDNDTNRFSWAQAGSEGFAAVNIEGGDDLMCYKRYPENDGENGYAWAPVIGSEGMDIDDIEIDWDYINTDVNSCGYTESENPSIGDVFYVPISSLDNFTVSKYESNVGYQEEGKGVIYYMKDEFNNQVYFDFKNILIFDELEINDYGYLFGKDDRDYSLDGLSNNNIIEGDITVVSPGETTGVLSIDTSLMFYDVVGYQNIVEIPEYTAGNNVEIEDRVITSNPLTITNNETFNELVFNSKMIFRYVQDAKLNTDSLYVWMPSGNKSEAEQIGKAYITDDTHTVSDATFYTGIQCTLVGLNGTFTAYLWGNPNIEIGTQTSDVFFTNKQASQISSTSDLYYDADATYGGGGEWIKTDNNTYKAVDWNGEDGNVIEYELSYWDGDVHLEKEYHNFEKLMTESQVNSLLNPLILRIQALEARVTALEPEPPAPTAPADNEIWYTTVNGQISNDLPLYVTLQNLVPATSANVVSHTYTNGKGVITFDSSIYSLQYWPSEDSGEEDWLQNIEKVWLPYFTEAEEQAGTVDINFLDGMLMGESNLTDVYYPGTTTELTYFCWPEEGSSEWETMRDASTNVIHCSDGDKNIR